MVSKDPLTSFFDQGFQTACASHKKGENAEVWKSLKGARIFLTGGTGFFGSWLLRLIQWSNQVLQTEIEMTVLSRDPKAFLEKRPEFADSSIRFITGDVRFFTPPKEAFSHIIHAATDASAKLNQENPLLMLDTITEGTRRVLELARICKPERLLFTSSGAVYGRQPPELSHITEDYNGCPNTLSPSSAYGEGKRLAEQLCSIYDHSFGIKTVIARCFAFAGPYLPWDIHFAIGNFIKDAVEGQTIRVKGDGTPYRSYLYGADLAFWLLTLLTEGQPGRAYHVGSEEAYSIRETAETVAEVISKLKKSSVQVEVAKKPTPNHLPERYVPSTERIRTELSLKENFSLRDSIEKSYEWHLLGGTHDGV